MDKKRIAENIYDVIKATALSRKDTSEWAELSRKHEKEARQELGQYLKDKHIDWGNNTINIGKHITITIN